MASAARDNWGRLVAAVVKKEQIWQLCHQNSISTVASDFSDGILSFSSNSLRPVSSSRSLQLILTNDSVIEDRKNSSKTITQKLFSTLLWRRKPTDYDLGQRLGGISEEYYGLQSISLHELIVATDNFSDKNFLGRGGHSTVYKGRLADGSLVAVKKIRKRSIEGELEIANYVKHRNVVELHGFCITQEAKLLVYPFMKNGSVASWLRAESQPPVLLWPVRKTIALEVAKGLAYLHHECIRGIIHCDVKAANILLDENLEAVVADFTSAQFMDCDDGVIKGTIGYIAPEYYQTLKFSEKTDVFAYGAFLLELITGQRALDLAWYAIDDGMMSLDWINNLFEKRMYEALVDSTLLSVFVEEEVEEMLQMALICMQKDPKGRPTMLEVVRMLEDGDGLPERVGSLMNNLVIEPSSSEVHENLEWIIDDSSSIGVEELSGPS